MKKKLLLFSSSDKFSCFKRIKPFAISFTAEFIKMLLYILSHKCSKTIFFLALQCVYLGWFCLNEPMFGVRKEVFVICLEKSANKCLYSINISTVNFRAEKRPNQSTKLFEEILKSSLLCGEKCVVNSYIRSSPSALIFETWHSLASHHLERWLKYFLL